MDYEKLYKEALERAREELGSGCFDRGTVEYIFPELKESEDDRIRKNIIEHLQYDIDDMAKSNNPFDCEAEIEELSKYIAWLEKQRKQNPLRQVSENPTTLVVGVCQIDSKGKVRFSVPLDGEWKIIDEEPKIIDMETKEILLKFMKWLEKRGFIKEDLCYDTEHQVETFVNQILPQI